MRQWQASGSSRTGRSRGAGAGKSKPLAGGARKALANVRDIALMTTRCRHETLDAADRQIGEAMEELRTARKSKRVALRPASDRRTCRRLGVTEAEPSMAPITSLHASDSFTGRRHRPAAPTVFLTCLAATSLLAMAGCTIGDNAQAGNASREATVSVAFEFGANDRSERQWRALLTALDECHREGYQDADLVRSPKAICKESGPNGCSRFAATASYDCIGMGYQSE